MAKRSRKNERVGNRDTVNQLLTKVHEKLQEGVNEGKATFADFIRLVQLEREMDEDEEDELTEIKVTWVDPKTSSDLAA